MEQASQNEKWIDVNLLDVYNNLELSDDLIDEICDDEDNPYKDLMHVLLGLKSLDAKKMFLILQFTKERVTTNYLAQILRKYGQTAIADKVVQFNRTEVLFPYRYDPELEIRRTRPKKSGYTGVFPMESTPRGVVLIIVNETQLMDECRQIEYILKEFHFNDIQIEINKTAEEIKALFTSLAQRRDSTGNVPNSVITIAIGHGQDEMFLGRDYNHGNKEDKVELFELVDTFSEEKCRHLRDKPKVHIFNCCRIKEDNNQGPKSKEGGDSKGQNTSMQRFRERLSKGWTNTNINSTVIYSCAEGQESFFVQGVPDANGFTYFGRALTHTFAQFACQYHLDRLMTQVNYRLRMDERPDPEYPEVIHYNKMWEIYFNP